MTAFLLPLLLVTALYVESIRRFAIAGAPIQLLPLAYGAFITARLRRGWFHPALPVANAIVENLVFALMYLATVLLCDAQAGAEFAALPMWGAYIVFTGIRGDPRIPLCAGAIASVQIILYAVVLPAEVISPATLIGATIARAVFFLISGALGGALACYLVTHTEDTLRAIREQDLFGKYLLGDRLGQGGMGEVFRATYCPEGGFVRTVAVKQVRADLSADPTFQRLFRDEARLAAGLAHPNLVQVHDCGKLDGRFILAMEYVDGLSLSQLLSRRVEPLELAAITFLGAEVAAALEYLHSVARDDSEPPGLVHRDVNPPNILISRRGDVKLGDLGVTRRFAVEPGQGGAVFAGKTAYAAPEQLDGKLIDGRADVYGLGATLYEALVARLLGRCRADSICMLPSQLRSGVPRDLDALVMDLVAPDRERRPSAADARARLLTLQGDAAPYPEGQALLAAAVKDSAGSSRDRTADRTASKDTACDRRAPRRHR